MPDTLDPSVAPDTGIPTEPDPTQAELGAPTAPDTGTPPEADPEPEQDWETRYKHAEAALGRQSNELGDLRKQVEDFRAILAQREQQPQHPQQPPRDPEQERIEAIRPEYERRYARELEIARRQELAIARANANARGEDITPDEMAEAERAADEIARLRAWNDAQQAYDIEQRAEQRAFQRAARQFAPVLARQEADQTVRDLGIEGVSAADVDGYLRQSFGQGLDALAEGDPQARQRIISMAAQALAYTKGKQAPTPKPAPVAGPQASPVTAPAPSSTASPGPRRAQSPLEQQAREFARATGMDAESTERFVAGMIKRGVR